MDDNTPNGPKNQSGPIFESVPVEEVPQALPPEDTPPDSTPADPTADPNAAFLNAPPPELTGDLPPLYEESKTKYFIIGGAVIFFILVFVVVLVLLLRGRSAQPTVAQEVTLTYWGLWEDPKIMEPLIAEYKQKNPNITVKYELQSPQDYRQKLIQRSRNEKGPDIFRFHNTWLPEVREVAAPLPKEIMSNEEFEKTFYPVHKADLGIETDYYGIPLGIDGIVMVYNQNLFQKAGISTPPTSWIGDLLDTVTQLTVQDRDGKLVTSGIAMGTASNIDHFSEVFGILLLQNGGSLDNLDKKEAIEAMQVYREFGEKNIWNDSMPNSIEAFAQEKVAIIFVPTWQILNIRGISQNPQFPLKVAPVPKGLDGKSLSLASYWVEGVSKYSKNQVEAWKFLKFLSEKETQQKLYELQTKARGLGTVSSRQDLQESYAQDPILGAVIQQAPSLQSLPLADRTFDKGMNDELVGYLRNAINETTTGVAYQQALDKAKKGYDQVKARYSSENQPTPGQ